MKTSTFELSVRVLFVALSVFVAGCNKDEFYEKDFLENPFKPDEQVDGGVVGGVDGSSVGGVDGATVGGSTDGSSTGGSTDGSTVGGTTGSTDGSTVGGTTGTTDGSSTAGSTDGSSTGGSTTGSTDGSSTAGSTDGSSTGGSTTGSTTGSTDGSSTAGSTDGSSTGGSTTGSTVGGTTGSTDGSSTGGSTTGSTEQWADETFNQTSQSDRKIDIMWVVDNSGSMGDEQQSLADNFDVFIRDFIVRGTDFRMGITTTDTSRPSTAGATVPGSFESLTAIQANANEQAFISNFKNKIQVGTRGSGNEKGLEASELFINRYKTEWMRDDAYLIVVYVSDEEDQSPKTKEEYLAALQASKTNAGYVKAYSIVNTVPCQSANGLTCGFERYGYQSEQTAGTVADIKSNFAGVLQDIGDSIINLLDTFPLANDPIVGTIEVRVNGVVQASGWSVTGRQLKFDAGSVPAVGASVQVRYQY